MREAAGRDSGDGDFGRGCWEGVSGAGFLGKDFGRRFSEEGFRAEGLRAGDFQKEKRRIILRLSRSRQPFCCRAS